jgi:tripartite-type tricarboxylate transporter receptor subunit TctC
MELEGLAESGIVHRRSTVGSARLHHNARALGTGEEVAMRMLSRRTVLAMTLPLVTAKMARAEDSPGSYPTHPVTFIVPFAPAGGTDILARLLGQKLEQRLGKPFVVENRPGAGTVIATNFVAKSTPDGYTIMMSVSSLAIDATLYKKLPYDPGKDLALVSLIASVPFVLVVNPTLPVHSVEDLIALAKKRPLSFGSGGIGAFHHLAAELFDSMTGIKMTHVPYRGTAPALNDLMGGYIQVMFSDLGPALPLINAGKLRALGVTTHDRFAAAPNIPPISESGVPGFDAAAWQGVIAPAEIPKDILAKLNAELNAIVALDDVRARLTDLGMNAVGKGSPEELNRFLQSEIVRWGKVVEAAGIARSE